MGEWEEQSDEVEVKSGKHWSGSGVLSVVA